MRTAEIERLREECEKLRKNVKMLEEGDKLKPARVEQIVIDEASPHEVKGKSKRQLITHFLCIDYLIVFKVVQYNFFIKWKIHDLDPYFWTVIT